MNKRMRNARMITFLIAGAAVTYYLLSRSGSMESTVSNIVTALGRFSRGIIILNLDILFSVLPIQRLA